jgi:aminoglycoside phosphotransferase (APT) family kinase protein
MPASASDLTSVVPEALAAWLSSALDEPGPFRLLPLAGGNSNETLMLSAGERRWIMRRPPAASIAPSAHNMEREHRILVALADTDVPAPAPAAVCSDPAIAGGPFLVMEAVDGHAITHSVPAANPDVPATVAGIGEAAIDALAALHAAPWATIGLEDFGRHEGFLDRQVARWSSQLERYRHRELPYFDEIGAWLDAHRPAAFAPGIMHGDFHLDNVLLTRGPRIAPAAIIDWEMATIGDPLLDLGLFLAFWGTDRPDEPAMPHVQAVSRRAGTCSREHLAARYAERSERLIDDLRWYMTLAFWKLASIVEGAYVQYVDGRLTTPYAARLEHDVPRLLREAAGFAGLDRA